MYVAAGHDCIPFLFNNLGSWRMTRKMDMSCIPKPILEERKEDDQPLKKIMQRWNNLVDLGEFEDDGEPDGSDGEIIPSRHQAPILTLTLTLNNDSQQTKQKISKGGDVRDLAQLCIEKVREDPARWKHFDWTTIPSELVARIFNLSSVSFISSGADGRLVFWHLA